MLWLTKCNQSRHHTNTEADVLLMWDHSNIKSLILQCIFVTLNHFQDNCLGHCRSEAGAEVVQTSTCTDMFIGWVRSELGSVSILLLF